ncbi:MAG: hypothetical protein AB7N76_01380 [Planctomycetota bacterium]
MSVLALISGHGFGHWTRSEAVLSRLATRREVHVRTEGRAALLARRAAWAASTGALDLGPGAAQEGPLAIDRAATLRGWQAHLERFDETLAAAAADARARGVRLVYADAPPLGPALAAALGVPCVVVANFSWSWILADYVTREPGFAPVVAALRAAEGQATHLVALAGGGGLEAFGAPVLETLLRRRPTCDEAEARRRLRAEVEARGVEVRRRPIVLVAFGGFGDTLDLGQAAAAHPAQVFVSFTGEGPGPENLARLAHDHGLGFQDLVFGADAVITKPGYGIVSEAANRPTPLVWSEPNPDFREHAVLARCIERWLPHAPLTREELLAGRWAEALRTALGASPVEPAPANGVDAILAVLADLR